MFAKKLLRKNDQRECRLLSLPGEIVLDIIKSGALDVFDKACLMLTCKSFAMLVCNPAKGLINKREMTSGEEEHMLEYMSETGMFDSPGMYSSDPEEAFEEEYFALSEKFAKRVDRDKVAKFYQRLDTGWNQSSMRFCYDCGVFKSTEQKFWDKKVKCWLHNKVGTISTRYQRMADCYCGCSADTFVSSWVEYGKEKSKVIKASDMGSSRTNAHCWYIACPECRLLPAHEVCDCCDCMMGCGCGSCHDCW